MSNNKYQRNNISIHGLEPSVLKGEDLSYGQYALTNTGDIVLRSEYGLVYLEDGSMGKFDDSKNNTYGNMSVTLLEENTIIEIKVGKNVNQQISRRN